MRKLEFFIRETKRSLRERMNAVIRAREDWMAEYRAAEAEGDPREQERRGQVLAEVKARHPRGSRGSAVLALPRWSAAPVPVPSLVFGPFHTPQVVWRMDRPPVPAAPADPASPLEPG